MKKKRNIAIIILSLIVIGAAIWAIPVYRVIYAPNVKIDNDTHRKFFYIRTGSTFNDVIENFGRQHLLKDTSGFRWLAGRMKYTELVKPGKYQLKDGMSNIILIKMLRLGQQTPVDINTNRARFKEDIASVAGKNLEADSSAIIKLLNNKNYIDSLGFNQENIMSLFMANTYRFQWNTSADGFLKRLKAEWDKVWVGERKDEAAKMGYSPAQIITLASIVQEETRHKDEAPIIAGVYLNRLRIGMPLQSDPTVKYAKLKENRSVVIQRIYFKDLESTSPYNTYKVKGLPPGPVIVPELWAIDAVLNADKNDYLYFVAKGDGSGYSHFSKTGAEHEEYSKKYHKALNDQNIH